MSKLKKEFEIEDYQITTNEIKWSQSSETYDIETLYEIENNEELIRVEMNTIEFPLFTKNKRISKNNIITYEFNNTKNQYLKVIPLAENKIPGELEEKIFFALMKLYKKNGHNQTIYTDFYTLITEMRIDYSGKMLSMVKRGLKILSGTNYEFNNLFYSNEFGGVLNDNIITNMFTIRIIQLKEATRIKNVEMLRYFRNPKIKEIIQIKFTGHFYENIIRKGYLYFDRQDLLQIENSVSRTLFLMLTKWRNKELYVKRYSKFLASRVPLSWKRTNIPGTLRLLKQAFEDLKKKKAIKEYRFNNDNGGEQSYFEIWFDKSHNKNFINNMSIEYTDNSDNYEITNQIKESLDTLDTVDDIPIIESEITQQIKELLELFPEEAKNLKTMPGKLEKGIKKYGYEYVKGAVLYTVKNTKMSFGKYFDGTLKNYWHEEFSKRNEKEKTEEIKKRSKQTQLSLDIKEKAKTEEALNLNMERAIEFYNNLKINNSKQAFDLENKAEEKYKKECNLEVLKGIQREIFERTKKSLVAKIIVEEKILENDEKILTRKEISSLLEKEVMKYAILYNIDESKELELKLEVVEMILNRLEGVTSQFITETLNNLIKKYI